MMDPPPAPAPGPEDKPAASSSSSDKKPKDKGKKPEVEERRSYPLRVGVAKPAVIYNPTCGAAQTTASTASPTVADGKAPAVKPASKGDTCHLCLAGHMSRILSGV